MMLSKARRSTFLLAPLVTALFFAFKTATFVKVIQAGSDNKQFSQFSRSVVSKPL